MCNVSAIAAAVWHFRYGRLVHVLLLLSWAHLALFSARNIPIFAVVSAPGIGLAVREWLERFAVSSHVPWLQRFTASLRDIEVDLQAIANNGDRRRWHLTPLLTVLLLVLLLANPGRVKRFRAEFDPHRFPVEAATALAGQQEGSSCRLYASWQWGGYLIYRLWPALTVFDDGRTDFYGPEFVEEGLAAWEARPDWADILARYGVNAALLPVDSALATVLRQREDWRLVYHDRISVLFRKTEDGK
jgi:hypothetical protein